MSRKTRPIRIEGDVAYVPLTKGYEAVIDAADVPLVEGKNWCVRINKGSDVTRDRAYAMRHEGPLLQQLKVHMHRVIAGTPVGMETDHINGDGLDNRRSNLRAATRAENGRNTRVRSDNTSGFKGVSWSKKSGKWRVEIMVEGRYRHLGFYASIDDAASAYAQASSALHGDFGRSK